MKEHTISNLMRRLSSAGFKKSLVQKAILPDWWSDECTRDSNMLPELEWRVARFLDVSLSDVRNPEGNIVPRGSGSALRRIKDIDKTKLLPAIHTATQVCAAVVRNTSDPRPIDLPPAEGKSWHSKICSRSGASLTSMVADLWNRGIAVVPFNEYLPTPNFQGIACMVGDRPVIGIGQRYDDYGRLAFIIAHEVKHILEKDCTPDTPVVDESAADVENTNESEQRADKFALEATLCNQSLPDIGNRSAREIAVLALQYERDSGADAGVLISSWARRTKNHAAGNVALKLIHRHQGARSEIGGIFNKHVDIDGASESDRLLLSFVSGARATNEFAG